MKLSDLLIEAKFADTLTKGDANANENLVRQLAMRFRHDVTVPPEVLAPLGKPTKLKKSIDLDIVKVLSNTIDATLAGSGYGDLSASGKFDAWLMKLYAAGGLTFEDLRGESSSALGIWQILSKRGLLRKEDQDFNRFKNLKQLQRAMSFPKYKKDVDRIKGEAELEKHKKAAKELVIIDDARFFVKVPFNYGACYVFNYGPGHNGNFCTGTNHVENAMGYFKTYSSKGIIVQIYDKTSDDEDTLGKWQFCAPEHQIYNATQNCGGLSSCDEKFSKLFPGLMKEIIEALKKHGPDIKGRSTEIFRGGGYDIDAEISKIKSTFPLSFASEAPKPVEPVKPPEVQKIKKKKAKAVRPG